MKVSHETLRNPTILVPREKRSLSASYLLNAAVVCYHTLLFGNIETEGHSHTHTHTEREREREREEREREEKKRKMDK